MDPYSLLDVAQHHVHRCSHKLHSHISFVIHKNKILSVGVNTDKTHAHAFRMGYLYGQVHSEFDAYRRLSDKQKAKRPTLINIRFNKNGKLGMSMPCGTCMPWCLEAFGTIMYSTSRGFVVLDS